MTLSRPSCAEIEVDIIAVALNETGGAPELRVREHVRVCAPCRDKLEGYRGVDRLVSEMRREDSRVNLGADAEAGLTARLADLRARLLTYGIFASPVGPILIARSEHGVALVEYLDRADLRRSRLQQLAGVEATIGGGEVEALYGELLEYLRGTRDRLQWPLDFRLTRGEFDRTVLRATAEIPRGAVKSYGGVAREIGRPDAVRAVAQALRRNPLPIVVPCHRVIGTDGALTGYAGTKLGLKKQLLGLEGVATTSRGRSPHVARDAMYAVTRGDSEYCLPTCGSMRTSPLAGLTLFGSREQAEATGLRPCTTCRPDLHPLASRKDVSH
jgi:O-6-methylguanine DNA methyltransferase